MLGISMPRGSQIPDFELSVMLVIIIISLFVMMASEFYVLKKDLHKIKYAILKKPHPSEREIKLAYEQAHRFPYLTVRRILLPHFLVFLYQLVPFLFYVFT